MSSEGDVILKSLWKFPSRPLPGTDGPVSPVFVTIWFVMTGVIAYVFFKLLKTREDTRPEYKTTMVGTGVLCFWYFIVVLDRWLHWAENSVQLGYCILMPVWDTFYALSTILILWGNYAILFREFTTDRFSELQIKIWWGVGYFMLFIVCLMSMFFIFLQLALSVVWMNFSSLNTIADVASKERQFEITMNAFFFGFSLLTTVAASVAIMLRTRRDEGKERKSQLLLYFANTILLARSTAQFGIVIREPNVSRNDTLLAGDVSYGLFTTIYLITIAYLLYNSTTEKEQSNDDIEAVRKDLRAWILETLELRTERRRKDSPWLASLLGELLENNKTRLAQILNDGPRSNQSRFSPERKLQVATEYIHELIEKYGSLNPAAGMDWDAASRASSAQSMGGRTTAQSRASRQSNRLASGASNRSSVHRSRSQELLARFKGNSGTVPEDVNER